MNDLLKSFDGATWGIASSEKTATEIVICRLGTLFNILARTDYYNNNTIGDECNLSRPYL
jgi:hypothetical protein